MLDKLEKIREEGFSRIAESTDIEKLEAIRRELTGKKSELQEVLKSLGGLDPDMRKSVGMKANEVKNLFAEKIQARQDELIASASAAEGDIDLTLPGIEVSEGALHPITQMCYDLNDAFRSLGFEIYNEDDISSEQFAFDNLNFAADHPARASMDTYWLEGTEDKRGNERLCLRPHLTGGSVRYLLEHGAPARFDPAEGSKDANQRCVVFSSVRSTLSALRHRPVSVSMVNRTASILVGPPAH